MKHVLACLGTAACLLLPPGGGALAGPRLVAMGEPGGGGGWIDLIVREVRVTPVRAHVGDPVRIDAVVENHGEGYGTITMRVYANGKPVASRMFTYDVADGPRALYRESLIWNTTGVKPGEYRIRAEAFDWGDSSPFDNSMDVASPVTLLPAGAAFSGGQQAGGEAVAVDPRWRAERPAAEPVSRNSSAPSGIEGETSSGRPR